MNTQNRAYSLLEIKAVDDERREITGVATTPEPDRAGDIVEPLGASFAAEIPLLWQHQPGSPVGTAKLSKPTRAGIGFTARIAKINEAGPLRDMVELAWQAVKATLVRGVSIGFRPKSHEYMSEGGVRFLEYEIIELSLATIPANASATIQTIKALDWRAPSAGQPVRLLNAYEPDLKGAVRLVRSR